jgi:hypothetical protein
VSLVLAAEPASMRLGAALLAVRDPDSAAAQPLASVARLDDRRRRHWSAPALAALAFAVVADESQADLMGVFVDRRRPLTVRHMAEAVQWAVEAAVGRPFGEAHVLAAWAYANHRLLRGRILLAGARPDASYSLADVLDMAAAALADMGVAGKHLDEAVAKAWQSRDEWGMGSSAEAAQRAMMGL